MALYRDWMNEAKSMAPEERRKMIGAIETLMSWKMFREEYREHGLNEVKTILVIEELESLAPDVPICDPRLSNVAP